MSTDKEWILKEFIHREDNILHTPYEEEMSYYTAVKSGNVELVKSLCHNNPLKQKTGLGILSKNKLQNYKYHFIITIALIARFCIEGGLEHEAAYSLSDFYIQKVDICQSVDEISDLHYSMSIDYAKRMRKLQKQQIYSKPVVLCVDYIYSHLHNRITVRTLAQYVQRNENYLSKLFKKETGMTISDYIMNKKIDTAKNMLQYSSYSFSEIASLLAFSSQSHFIKQFRRNTGITPKQYQNKFFMDVNIHSKIHSN